MLVLVLEITNYCKHRTLGFSEAQILFSDAFFKNSSIMKSRINFIFAITLFEEKSILADTSKVFMKAQWITNVIPVINYFQLKKT